MFSKKNCVHPEYALAPGDRVPLLYGSAPTEHCSLCGSFRIVHDESRSSKNSLSNWKPASALPEAMRESETY